MLQSAWVATRKGLCQFELAPEGWQVGNKSFVCEPLSMVLPGNLNNSSQPMIAAPNLGHFSVKCHALADGGNSWREIATPACPPQPEALNEGTKDIEWKLPKIWSMAAADGVIETLHAGSPQSYCYDPIYRHALAVSDDGQRLTMGSTTGNLWVSDDGGNSGQTLSNNLPPIFSVRFEGLS